MTDRDAMIEAVARALCKSGEFETGHGTCAWICMDQLGEARKGPCLHAETVHRDLATTALEAAEPFITAREQAAREEGRDAEWNDVIEYLDNDIRAWLDMGPSDRREWQALTELAGAITRNKHREQQDG